MLTATHAFAESAAEASNRTLADMKSACAGTTGSNCYQAMQANDAASKRLVKEVIIYQPERNRQRQQEVIQDEQLRQQVRQRGY
jgi:ribulose bisphosphate carboxylase small subunit